MARKPRIHYPGACYHVILRGNAGQAIFFNKQDGNEFFLLLQEGVEKFRHRIHAYCLMTNHVHLAVQVAEIPLSRIIQNLSFRYSRYVNKRKGQIGHLFQGRYKAILIDADNYLLQLVRYIHNNPVRAGIVDTPDKYPWCSHSVYIDDITVPWLTTDWVLSQFDQQKETAINYYRSFINVGLDEGHVTKFHRGNAEGEILGSDSFAEEAHAKASQEMASKLSIEQIINTVCDHYKIHEEELTRASKQRQVSEPRAMVALLVREATNLNLMDLSRRLSRDLSGLSQAASRLEKRAKHDKELAETIERIKKLVRGRGQA
jgi:REP element-mobilizing transposase RayT